MTFKLNYSLQNGLYSVVCCVWTFVSLFDSKAYMSQLSLQSVSLYFVFMGFVWFSLYTAIVSLNSIVRLIFVMVKCGVLCEVRTEFLNSFYTIFDFKGLTRWLLSDKMNLTSQPFTDSYVPTCVVLSSTAYVGGYIISEQTAFFSVVKNARFVEPQVPCRLKLDAPYRFITITARYLLSHSLFCFAATERIFWNSWGGGELWPWHCDWTFGANHAGLVKNLKLQTMCFLVGSWPQNIAVGILHRFLSNELYFLVDVRFEYVLTLRQ
jgi:hypothetical protein